MPKRSTLPCASPAPVMFGQPVVLDTNVFVAAAFNPKSHAARIIAAVRNRRLRMTWSRETREETRLILQRIPPISWEPAAALFLKENEHFGDLHPEQFANISDPDDRKFAALAFRTHAILITQDDDLLSQRTTMAVRILRPAEFLEEEDI